MSQAYRAVGWTPHKKIYDAVLAGGVVLYLAVFVGLGIVLDSNATIETQLIRALGTCALFLLHVILAIGPLARLDPRFLPLLYNRRHLGVTMFLMALGHAVFGIVQFHALGDVNPLVSVLVSNTRYGSVSQFPFEALGLVALLILFAMATTSHDFWLANLTAPVWKSLLVAVLQAPFAPGLFEFGYPRSAQGTVIEHPYPLLLEDGAARATLLVREGKHGASSDVAGLDGRRVELEATRIESPLGRMLEIVPGTLEATRAAAPGKAPETVGPVLDLVGEPVLASGTVERRAGLLVLRLGQAGLRRAAD